MHGSPVLLGGVPSCNYTHLHLWSCQQPYNVSETWKVRAGYGRSWTSFIKGIYNRLLELNGRTRQRTQKYWKCLERERAREREREEIPVCRVHLPDGIRTSSLGLLCNEMDWTVEEAADVVHLNRSDTYPTPRWRWSSLILLRHRRFVLVNVRVSRVTIMWRIAVCMLLPRSYAQPRSSYAHLSLSVCLSNA